MAHVRPRTTTAGRRYDVCWRENGKDRSRTFILRKDADRFRVDVERRAQLGTLYEPAAITLAAARDSWRARWIIGKAVSTVAQRDDAWHHAAALEHVPLSQLSGALVEDTIAAAARVAPRQAQVALSTVKMIARDAQRRGQRIQPELLTVKAPGYASREPVFLTCDEVEQLASWCTVPTFVLFSAFSGLRVGETLALRSTDVDRDAGTVLVARSLTGRTKSRKRRQVDLCQAALHATREQLAARTPNRGDLLFPAARGGAWTYTKFRAKVWRPAVDRMVAATGSPARAGELDRLTIHDLRHTFASLMIAAGANPLQVAEALGHTDRSGRPDPTLVWKRYGHLYPGSTREAARALDRHLEAVAS